MGIKGKRGKVVKGGKKGKSERVAERKKKEEDSEGAAEVTTVGLLRGVGKRCPGFAMGGLHQGGGWSGFAVGGFQQTGLWGVRGGKALTSPNCIKHATHVKVINSSQDLSVDCTPGLFRRITSGFLHRINMTFP